MKNWKTSMSLILGIVLAALPVHAAKVGSITYVEGRVEVTGTDDQIRSAATGMDVNIDDIVSAFSDARAEITFVNDHVIRLGADTEIQIADYISTAKINRGIFKLIKGKMESRVKRLLVGIFGSESPNRFEVQTPTAVVGVRGTRFFTSYADGITESVFATGMGYGYNPRFPEQVMDINAGESFTVSQPDAPPTVAPAGPGVIEQFIKETAPEIDNNSEEQIEYALKDTKDYLANHPVHHWYKNPAKVSLTDDHGGRGNYLELALQLDQQTDQLEKVREQKAELARQQEESQGDSDGGGGGCGG